MIPGDKYFKLFWGCIILWILLFLGFQTWTANAGPRCKMLTLTNQDRIERDVEPLRTSVAVLSQYAKRHAQRMADAGEIFHSPTPRLIRQLDRYNWHLAGENVGVGYSMREIQQAFMKSPPHRRNVLNPAFNRMAAGAVREGGLVWLVVIYFG